VNQILPSDWTEQKIYLVRNQKVILSYDLAELYQVAPKALVQAVKRNKDRFPADFIFQLENHELANLKSQFVTSSWGGLRKNPYAFTEQGIAMLSGVLKSPRAIQINIEIMRTFVKLRKYIASYKELSERIDQIETEYDHQFKIIFDTLQDIVCPPQPKGRRIGIVNDD
jgi:hypothetical protein